MPFVGVVAKKDSECGVYKESGRRVPCVPRGLCCGDCRFVLFSRSGGLRL